MHQKNTQQKVCTFFQSVKARLETCIEFIIRTFRRWNPTIPVHCSFSLLIQGAALASFSFPWVFLFAKKKLF